MRDEKPRMRVRPAVTGDGEKLGPRVRKVVEAQPLREGLGQLLSGTRKEGR